MSKFKYGDKLYFTLVSMLLFINASVSALSLYVVSLITDAATSGKVEHIKRYGLILLLIVFISLFISLIETYIKKIYLKKSMLNLRMEYMERLFKLNITVHNAKSQAEYMSNLVNDMSRYENVRYIGLLQLVYALSKVVTSLFLLYIVNIYMVIAGILMFLFTLYTSSKTSKPLKQQEQTKSISLSYYTEYIKETLLGFFIIKQHQLEANKTEEFKVYANNLATDNLNLDRKATHIDALNSFIHTSIMLILIIFGISYAKTSDISIGTVILAGTAFVNSMYPMQQIMPLLASTSSINVLLEDFDKVLYLKKDVKTKKINDIESIKFQDVDLAYDDNIILSDVSFTINKNEKVLIVGGSGQGKSTILKSIRRQLEVSSNKIFINDIDINSISDESYYKCLSVVDQIGFVFTASLKDNITLYKEAKNRDIENILSIVGLNDLTLDYELINDGSNISGGQRTRLLLARSLFLDSGVIIGDEIFAALNQKVAADIERVMLHLDKTLINVSHIVFEDNFDLYDKVILVKDKKISIVNSYNDLRNLDVVIF